MAVVANDDGISVTKLTEFFYLHKIAAHSWALITHDFHQKSTLRDGHRTSIPIDDHLLLALYINNLL